MPSYLFEFDKTLPGEEPEFTGWIERGGALYGAIYEDHMPVAKLLAILCLRDNSQTYVFEREIAYEADETDIISELEKFEREIDADKPDKKVVKEDFDGHVISIGSGDEEQGLIVRHKEYGDPDYLTREAVKRLIKNWGRTIILTK